jgi:hypothetical protein
MFQCQYTIFKEHETPSVKPTVSKQATFLYGSTFCPRHYTTATRSFEPRWTYNATILRVSTNYDTIVIC